jgi:SH3-like domain-containing protein
MAHRRAGFAALVVAGALAALPVSAQLRPQARPADRPAPPLSAEEAAAVLAAAPVAMPAEEAEAPAEEAPVGRVTGLPIPRFVSLKASEGNARRGPSLSHRVDWVFLREDMPLRITAEYGHWRRVEDRDGQGGWIHYSLLSGTRTVIVDQDRLPLRARPDERSPEMALLEAGVVARLESCGPDWCRIGAGGYRGWVQKAAIWGVGADEIID